MGNRSASSETAARPARRARVHRASSTATLAAFFASLARARARVLFSDYDGTLAPFRGGLELVAPHPGVPEALREMLEAGSTRLVIVSGRSMRSLKKRVAWLEPRPELWGSHGLERWTPQRGDRAAPIALPVADVVEEVSQWVDVHGWRDLLERKPYGLALHERPDPERYSAARQAVLDWWLPTLLQRGLAMRPFDGGVEFRPADAHKGQVVERVLSELPPDAAAAYLGDDLTDEDAFAAMRGRGLRILVRERRRPTDADLWLRPPEELVAFLNCWRRALRGARCDERAVPGRAP